MRMSSEPPRQVLVNPWNTKSLFTYACSTGLLHIFSLLINIHFRDIFVQQSSHVLGEVDVRERKGLLETKECESGRKGRSSGKAKTGDLRLQQFEESLSWDEQQSVIQLSQFTIMKFQLLDLTGCRA